MGTPLPVTLDAELVRAAERLLHQGECLTRRNVLREARLHPKQRTSNSEVAGESGYRSLAIEYVRWMLGMGAHN